MPAQESLSLSHAVSIALNAIYQSRLAFLASAGDGVPQADGYDVNRASGIVAAAAAARA